MERNMDIQQKMHLFYTCRRDWYKLMKDVLNTHKWTRQSEYWHEVMKDVFDNFDSMSWTGREAITTVHSLYQSGFERLCRWSILFFRCMLKWCVEEDGSINKDFVDILTDVETHMADAVRFILQHAGTGPSSFDGKDFSNIDHLLPRMVKACLRVLTADSSPPNFCTGHDLLQNYGFYLNDGNRECLVPIWQRNSKQITKVRTLTELVNRTKDDISHKSGQELLISFESLYDKVACRVLLGCWESYYNYMYLFGPASKMGRLFHACIQRVLALHSDACPVAIWTDKILKVYIDYLQNNLMQIQEDQDIDLTPPVKDQLKRLRRAMGITVIVHTDYLPHFHAKESNLQVDLRVEVQALARSIESLGSSYFTTQTEDINYVITAAVDKVSLVLRNFVASITKDRVMHITNYMHVSLTHEFLIEFVEHAQQFMSQMLEDDNIIEANLVKDQLEMLHHDLRFFVNFHVDYSQRYYAVSEGTNVVDMRVEVQTVARDIESFIYSFITQTEDIKLVVADAAAKIILGLRNLAALFFKAWVTTCKILPLNDELLIQFMEYVQRLMSQMLMDKEPTGPVKDQVECLHLELGILVQFHINYPPQLYAEEGSNLVAVRMEVQTVAWNIASFIYCYLIIQTKHDAPKVVLGLQNLLESILRAWAVQLTLNTDLLLVDELMIHFKERIQHIMRGTLKDENTELPVAKSPRLRIQDDSMGFLLHKIFKYKENHSLEKETTRNVTTQVLVHMRNISTKINRYIGNRTKDLGPSTSFPRSDLVEKFSHLKAEVMDTIFLTLVCRLRRGTPETDQLNFFNFLLENMKQLVSGGSDLIGEWVDEIQKIHEALLLFRDFLQCLTDVTHLRDICERVMNVAYEAEYLIYSFYDGSYPPSCIALWIFHFSQDVELTKASVMNIFEKKENDGRINIHDSTGDQNQGSSQALIPTADLVVGFESEIEHVKQQLFASNHVKQLDVVSVIGMPGLGKTTLARKVYEDRQTAEHFEIRAWCCVSNEYSKRELLLTILGCINELTDIIKKMNDSELSTCVYKQLMGRRYLIVMDDVWGIDAFEFLKLFFPDNNNGSRILLTSRNKVIGLKAKHRSDPLELRMLTDDESWLLLSKKVYPNQKCPLELCQVGKKIAKNCRGLPLAIVVVAGLLAKSYEIQEFWEQVAENLTPYMAYDSQTQGMAVLELSYKHLPRHLKPLFLYIGAFPEDREVPVEKLIWLWIAEGFVKDNQLMSLEHQAEVYLMDLIDRSFLMVAARRSDGKVKTCIVHDLLRDMCLLKAKEEHFMQQINVSDDLPDPIFYQVRLSILLNRRKEGTPTHLVSDGAPTKPYIAYEDLSTLSLAPPLYSLLFFNKNRSLPLWTEAVASVLCDLRLLRVLHFESTSISSNLCGDVMMLVHLRYISIRAAWNSIPSAISKLQNLETLIIKGLRGEIEVPQEIWELFRLRHLHVNDRAKFREARDGSSMLENLETLSTPVIHSGEEVKLMIRIPNVRKLRCVFLESCPQLEYYVKLESVKAIYAGTGRCLGPLLVPLTLTKLSLSKFRLEWEEISKLTRLPHLEILNLRIRAVDGEFWNMDDKDEGFPKLKVLKLESLNMKAWTACAENFPSLEKLVLKKCKQLMEIPSELGDINCLQKMEVLQCSNFAAISAKSIEKEQKDAGNESLEVHIYPPVGLG